MAPQKENIYVWLEKKVHKKTSRRQFEMLVAEMEGMPDITRGIGKFGSSKIEYDEKWGNVSKNLNDIGPPTRTIKEWKKAATLRRINFNDEEFDPIVYLMMKPFKSLSIEEKIIFKSLRKMPQLNISQKDGKILRRFQIKWYEKYNWLIGSQELNKVFCYHCFLFGGCEAWAKSGIGIVKNFEGRAKKHASTEIHLRNQEQFIMLGRTTIDHSISSESRMLAMEHNEKVTKNRHILSRLIDVVCFLGRQQLAFSDNFENETSTNKGNYIELLHLLNIGETTMRDHLELNAVFKGTSSQIQNELISIVTLELYNNIQTQLNEVQFVSIQADETTDVACKSQISIIIRYVHNIEVCERFLGFFDVSNDDKTAIGLSNVILDVLEKRKLKDKLISQTYDGACMMSGNKGGVQAFIKEHCPQVYLQHCYDHQLNLVLLYGAKHIKLVKHFICNLTAFHTFFSRSSLRSNVLQSKGFSLPHPNDNRWNYKSRSINTISEHFTELKSAFEHIINSDDFDYESTNMAVELSNILKKPTFRFLLCLYFEIFFYIDHLYDLLQIEVISNISICLQETDSALNAIKALKNDDEIKRIQQKANELFETEPFAEEVAESCRVTALAIIDTICYQMELRFSDLNKFKFVQLVHSKAFKSYNKKFPEELLDSLIEAYPNVFLKEKLRNELKIVYSDTLKRKKPLDMLVFIKENELTEVYSELSKLLSLFLTIPITPISSEKSSISTLKRIKRFLTNSMSHDGLNDLSALSIEKNFLQELCLDPAFKEKIIDKFASEKNRSFHLMYKKV